MTDRKKPGVAFWATVVVAALVGYPLAYVGKNVLDHWGLQPKWEERIANVVFYPLDEMIGSGG